MRVLLAVLVAGLTVSLAAGCGIGKAKDEAEQVAESYFEATQQKDLDAAMKLFSEKFFTATPRDDWRAMLEKIGEKLGTPQSHKLVRWHVFKGTRTRGLSGTVVELSYEATYEKYPAQVSMVVHKPIGGKDFKIVRMDIDSRGLLLE